MSILQRIHAIWPTIDALEALLPVARVFTGRVPADIVLPCCSVTQDNSTGNERTSDGLYRDVQIQFSVWVAKEQHDAGAAIQAAIENGFASRDFADGDNRVLDMRLEDSGELEEDDEAEPLWQFITTFTALERRDRVQ